MQMEEEFNYNFKCQSLNEEQKNILNLLITELHSNSIAKKQFFVNGSGGCGKTFLYETFISYVRSKGLVCLAMATTGNAATILPNGTTAHFGLKLSLKPTETSMCDLREGSKELYLVKNASVLIIDEATQLHKLSVDELDRTLRLIMGNVSPILSETPFGGKFIIFGGDWKQCPPVIKHGNHSTISASIMKNSLSWPFIVQLFLTQNMRMGPEFKNWIKSLKRIRTNVISDEEMYEIRNNKIIEIRKI
jgi:hypothetical protein